MRQFMDRDFLLTTQTAQHLYHDVAAELPIVDYHCHLSPREIWENKPFSSIVPLWLGGDHYKWRIMRACGVEERYITGDAPDREKFQKWAETLAQAIGNPIYHWSHLELRRYFGYEGLLNGDTAEEVWQLCNEKLQDPAFCPRGLIESSHVAVLCTTDDPVDDLHWHEQIAADGFTTKVLPAFRPDKAIMPGKTDYLAYIQQLASVCGRPLDTYDELEKALLERVEYFHAHGCRLSDHGLDAVPYAPASVQQLRDIYKRRLNGEIPTESEQQSFQYALLRSLGRAYASHGWVMQLHYGAMRNNSRRLFAALGADVGGDAIGPQASIADLARFLNALDEVGALPRTILYSLHPGDNAAIETVMGCFQGDGIYGKIQHGSAWWFNDHLPGMREHLTSLAANGMLATFVGMLTDSRSFLSYARHEYFRRILCQLLGEWVEAGLYPDGAQLERIVRGICYENAHAYFRF